jgi:6-phosphogluconolactonase
MGEEILTAEIEPIDDRRELVVPGNYEETLDFAVEHWIDSAKHAIADRGKFTVALSGGTTPKIIFQRVCSEEHRDRIDWEKVFLFWGDERTVSPDHASSNFRMAMDAGFSSMPIDKNHIFRMEAEKNLGQSCQKYERYIKEHVEDQEFDLIMLGMGDDGHTASLFPGTEALKENRKFVVGNFVPKLSTWRMTFTYPLINMGRRICFYVIGKEKSMMLAEVLKGDENPTLLPSQAVGTSEHKALWIVDHNAAELL